MADLLIEKLADVLVDYSLELRAGDLFRLRADSPAEALTREVYRRAVRRGADVALNIALPGFKEIFYEDAPDSLLELAPPVDQFLANNITADLVILADANTRALTGIDPARIARAQKGRAPVSRRWNERALTDPAEIRWCAALFPTNALAQDAGLSLTAFERIVYQAMLLNQPDPVQAWRDLSAEQTRLADLLTGTKMIRVVAPDTDLTLRVAGRPWRSSDGRRNFPDGEVFTCPREDSATGMIRFTFPVSRDSREAEDVRLWLEDGQVVRAQARRGQELLDETLAVDEGARRVGEFAIGNNYALSTFTRNILVDEKIGGTCHLALGNGIPAAGGVNRSVLHWDMVCDLRQGGVIFADGEIVHENGQWKI